MPRIHKKYLFKISWIHFKAGPLAALLNSLELLPKPAALVPRRVQLVGQGGDPLQQGGFPGLQARGQASGTTVAQNQQKRKCVRRYGHTLCLLYTHWKNTGIIYAHMWTQWNITGGSGRLMCWDQVASAPKCNVRESGIFGQKNTQLCSFKWPMCPLPWINDASQAENQNP